MDGDGLFEAPDERRPLADRMRPGTLDEVVGMEALIGPGGWIRRAVEAGRLPSMIFHGPPGTGKTTLGLLLARAVRAVFVPLNAVATNVAEMRKVLEGGRARLRVEGRATVVFLDEIHRLNRAQQDVLLPYVEDGSVVLIGATTQNPFFDVNGALLSRSRTVAFPPLDDAALEALIARAVTEPRGLGLPELAVSPEARDEIIRLAAGDGRVAISLLEQAVLAREDTAALSLADVRRVASDASGFYDRVGDEHYQTVSALIKSLRGSDPDSALLWLAKMLERGDDVRFVARRLVILAAEDVGLADPAALGVAMDAARATEFVGRPECDLILAEATLYLALAPKSNSATAAIARAKDVVRRAGRLPVPPHLRNLEGRAKREAGAEDYRYPHDFPGHWVRQGYWPQGVPEKQLYEAGAEGAEPALGEWRRQRGDPSGPVGPEDGRGEDRGDD